MMEFLNSAATEDYGVCWSHGRVPEILNLNTGLNESGVASKVSKMSFRNSFESLAQTMPDCSDAGTQRYNEAKAVFSATLEKNNFGVWSNKNSVDCHKKV